MEALIRRVCDLVAIPSVNPMGRTDIPAGLLFERHAAEYAAAEMRAIGLSTEMREIAPDRWNAWGVHETPGKPSLLLDAHLDTVPVDGMDDPFDPRIENGAIRGRGSCDTKGSLAVFLTALEELIVAKTPLAYTVMIAATADEELRATGARALAGSLSHTPPALAIFGEPTSLDVIYAHKGAVRLGVETLGHSAHSSSPGQGQNALYTMARVLLAIEELGRRLAEEPDAVLGPPSVNPGVIRGGLSVNTVPDLCRVDLDVRLVRRQTADTARRWLQESLVFLPHGSFRITAPDHEAAPVFTDPTETHAARFIGACARRYAARGRESLLRVAPYATDAQAFSPAGVPCLVFGPGDIGVAHTPAESVPVVELRQAVETLKDFLTEL